MGPVKSLLYITKYLNDQTIITYCDFLVDWNFEDFKRFCFGKEIVIPYFIGFHPASEGGTTYDYLKLNKKNLVMNIGVKKNFTKNKKNEPGVVGSYYFNEINHLKKVLEEIRFDKKEIYLSHLIILMIKNKINVYPYKVNKFLCLGTPKDYYQYKNFDNYFHRKKQKIF